MATAIATTATSVVRAANRRGCLRARASMETTLTARPFKKLLEIPPSQAAVSRLLQDALSACEMPLDDGRARELREAGSDARPQPRVSGIPGA